VPQKGEQDGNKLDARSCNIEQLKEAAMTPRTTENKTMQLQTRGEQASSNNLHSTHFNAFEWFFIFSALQAGQHNNGVLNSIVSLTQSQDQD